MCNIYINLFHLLSKTFNVVKIDFSEQVVCSSGCNTMYGSTMYTYLVLYVYMQYMQYLQLSVWLCICSALNSSLISCNVIAPQSDWCSHLQAFVLELDSAMFCNVFAGKHFNVKFLGFIGIEIMQYTRARITSLSLDQQWKVLCVMCTLNRPRHPPRNILGSQVPRASLKWWLSREPDYIVGHNNVPISTLVFSSLQNIGWCLTQTEISFSV